MSVSNSSQSGLTRRNFLKTTGVVAGAVAVGGVAASGFSNLAFAEEVPQDSRESKTVVGACMRAGCVTCQHNIDVRDGKVVKAWPLDNEERGHRPCLRGLSEIQRLYSPDRPKYPMRRAGERGSGEWERISWDEAITTITDTWKKVAQEYGPAANVFVAGSASAGAYTSGLPGRLANVLGMSRVDICCDMAKNNGIQRLFGGSGYDQPGSTERDADLSNADTIFVWGSNLSESYAQRWRALMDAKEKGAKIIVIDPNYTTTASKADEWISVRPGSDPALTLSMVQVLLDKGTYAEDFLRANSVAPYLVREDTKEFLRMSTLGIPATEGPVNPQTGKPTIVDPPVVWDTDADTYAPSKQAGSPAMEGSWEIEGFKVKTAFDLFREEMKQYAPEKAAEIVDIDAGTIERLAELSMTGKVIHIAGLGPQAFDNGVHIGTTLSALIAITGMLGEDGTGMMGFYWGSPYNKNFSAPTGTTAKTIPYLCLFETVKTGEYNNKPYPIKTILCQGSGFLGGYPDPNALKREVLDKVELFVVVDVAMTDGARYADIVLPATHYYENEDIIIGGLNRVLFYVEQAIDPLYECKADADISRLFAKEMGVGEHFSKTREEFLEEIVGLPAYEKAGVSVERLKKEHFVRWAPETMRNNEGNVYTTPTGKIEIYSEKPKPRFDFGQKVDIDAERIPRFFPPKEAWPDREIAKKYPLILTSVRSRNRWHTQGFEKAWLLELMEEPVLYMNPDDAAARNLAAGDYVDSYNDRGHAVSKLILNPGVRSGMLVYPKGWQAHQFKSGSFSELLSSEFDPIAVNNSFFDTAVEVRKWEEEV